MAGNVLETPTWILAIVFTCLLIFAFCFEQASEEGLPPPWQQAARGAADLCPAGTLARAGWTGAH